ncbi:hypothetical protein GH741_02975 [Aquibacillus halophilus]|uniref:Uncharacterized protein n=1 Tax=Aquibacillus halophilus TaxID=930132 RepID=A0A6A8D7Q9_9BACI|nr:hypothetical protein [Aquibacillus halophilus]MRH41634.1 hypothetical protein [Aquibacillus halophilus]
MKKLIVILIVTILVFSLAACNAFNSNTISIVELTERENAILSTTSEKSFVFEFNVDSEFDEISVWIEKYEFGRLVDEKLNRISTQVEKNGSIIFTNSINNNENQNTFNIGIGSNGGAVSSHGFDKNAIGLDKMSSVWGNFQGKKTFDEEQLVLANISYSSNENSTSSVSTSFFEDVEGRMIDLKEYDVSYLLKVEFIK